ncbi:MAG: nucleoside triphosphate diphosphatase [Blastocatellia bacterium]|jgi:MazG family protein|nr:nucleoside triphosphate diphosphatase [Blastocatellia bacterium]
MPVNFNDLVALMARLRSPEGCPWDREQTYATLAPMLLEEAYEAFDALEEAREGRADSLREELGDLLFQITFFAKVAEERGEFNIDDVIATVHEKMVRRHPHVFADVEAGDSAAVLRNWEAIKAEEKRAARGDSANDEAEVSLLAGVSRKAPALMEAHQLTTKAARVGFDWEKVTDIFAKLDEETEELRAAIAAHAESKTEADHTRMREEVGDLLFVVTNIARHLQVEPEAALKLTNRKFRRRFEYIETKLRERRQAFENATLDEMESLWQAAKLAEINE